MKSFSYSIKSTLNIHNFLMTAQVIT